MGLLMQDPRQGCHMAVLILMPLNQQAAKGVTLLAECQS